MYVEDHGLIIRLAQLLVPPEHDDLGPPGEEGGGNTETSTAAHGNGVTGLIALGPEVWCP